MRKRTLKRGLFKREFTVLNMRTAPVEEVKAFFARQKYGAGRTRQGLDIMRAAAKRALADAGLQDDLRTAEGLEGNAALAVEVLGYIDELEGHRRHQRLEDAIYAAMLATQAWMKLRVNALFERDVRAREKQRAALPKRKVSDRQIRSALVRNPTQVDTAVELDISPRQLRNRIREMSRKKRK